MNSNSRIQAERRKQALRDNLKRRKAQQRDLAQETDNGTEKALSLRKSVPKARAQPTSASAQGKQGNSQ